MELTRMCRTRLEAGNSYGIYNGCLTSDLYCFGCGMPRFLAAQMFLTVQSWYLTVLK
jgi:hypothetical protein